MIVFVWVVLRKCILFLPFLDLRSQEWFSTVKNFLQTSVSISRRCDPMLRFICSSTCDTILFIVQFLSNTNDLNWIASRVRQRLLHLRDMFADCLSLIQYSMSSNIDMNMILLFWNHTVPWNPRMFEFLSPETIVYWCCRVPYFGEFWRPCFSHTQHSLRHACLAFRFCLNVIRKNY